MVPPLGLDSLLAALREAGLRVGVGEVERLRCVLDLEPDFSGDANQRVRSLLRAVVVKRAEERDVFEKVCDTWLENAAPTKRLDLPRPAETPGASRPPKRRWRALAGVAALLVVAITYLISIREPQPPPPLPPPPPTEVEPLAGEQEVITPTDVRERQFESWVPTLTVIPAEPEWKGWPTLSLGLLALLTAGGLWQALNQRRWLPEAAPPPTRKGPPRVFLTPSEAGGFELLDDQQQETLVWGIGRFVAEEETRRLDLPATVRAIAKAGGRPQLCFQKAHYLREVWLWVDEAAADPTLPRLAAEVEMTLKAHGLPVERATFRGVPELLVTGGGNVFAPREVDERRHGALVAVLTDGRTLLRQRASDMRAVHLDALLRQISHWPRLAFVDFSGGSDLGLVLDRHEIDVIRPDELASFLGTDTAARPVSTVAVDPTWVAACALAPSSVDEWTAFALHQRLGLSSSAWALRQLRQDAGSLPGRLAWTPAERARCVNWLTGVEGGGEGSRLDAALDFWEEIYDGELERRDNGWRDTPGYQHWVMERALVRLWRDPDQAAHELYELHQVELGETIEDHLVHMAPRGLGGDEQMRLPWSWGEVSLAARVMLREMKLGGGMSAESLQRPGRMWLGIGVALGLAVGAIGASIQPSEVPDGAPVFESRDEWPKRAGGRIAELPQSGWEIVATTPKRAVHAKAAVGDRVRVQWAREEKPCVEGLDAEIWRCGTVPSPPSLFNDSKRTVAVLVGPKDPETEVLAVDLLDSGSMDVVVIDPDGLVDIYGLLGIDREQDQWLVINVAGTESVEKLTEELRFEGERTVAEVWPGVQLLEGDPSQIVLRGLTGCRMGQEMVENGMVFVRVCGGAFMMGSPDSENGRWNDEGPVHEVTLSEFWIGKYEVSNEQYRRFQPTHQSTWADPDLPVHDVTWYDSRDFCGSLGYRLPTEAEWEYTARAGTTSPWSFGDDESKLDQCAWFSGNSDGQPQPVGGKAANPWGVHDMHGNIDEWVADWSGNYIEDSQKNPTGPADGVGRVLRGGSFANSPGNLRSANRNEGGPEFSFRGIGFRCVRLPRRQP